MDTRRFGKLLPRRAPPMTFTILALAGALSGCARADCASLATCGAVDEASRPGAAPSDAGRPESSALQPTGTAPSCKALPAICGASANDDCCASTLVPGGTFKRSYDGISGDASFIATVSDFRLDVYEVTVARFLAFLAEYPGNIPAAGDGSNPNDPRDAGWDSAWNRELPATASALTAALRCDTLSESSAASAAADTTPMPCLTWYEAFAFCAWDGGRLPTEAEWNYAAAAGKEQRVYPWSSPATSSAIDESRAVYGTSGTRLLPVGSKPQGAGKWRHADLGGNVAEWTRDWWQSPYRINPCDDCSEYQKADPARVLRGGGAGFPASNVRTAARDYASPMTRRYAFGARCARSP